MKKDVIVIGGGTTGCCAAVAAARTGAKTILIESNGFVGGNAVNGIPWLGFHHPHTGNQVVTGIPFEIITRLQRIDAATRIEMDPICGSVVAVNSTFLKIVLFEMLKEAGVEIMLHTVVSSVVRKDSGDWSVFFSNAQENSSIDGDYVIDSTDCAFAAISAGADYIFGRDKDNKPQVSSCVVRFGNIDIDRLIDYFQLNPTQMRPFRVPETVMMNYLGNLRNVETFIIGAFPDLIRKAKAEGVDYPRDRLIGAVNVKEKEMILVASRIENVNPRNNSIYSVAEMSGLFQTYGILKLLREYLPGCEKANVVASGHSIGMRETNHIEGDYLLTADDLMCGKKFSDAIARGGYHLDIHCPDNDGLETHFPPEYQIPYSCLLPRKLENMILAGRCISATQESQASVRVIPILGAIGQAAGTACALAKEKRCSLRDIDIRLLQDRLESDGATI